LRRLKGGGGGGGGSSLEQRKLHPHPINSPGAIQLVQSGAGWLTDSDISPLILARQEFHAVNRNMLHPACMRHAAGKQFGSA
jgi:hypothetical protein